MKNTDSTSKGMEVHFNFYKRRERRKGGVKRPSGAGSGDKF